MGRGICILLALAVAAWAEEPSVEQLSAEHGRLSESIRRRDQLRRYELISELSRRRARGELRRAYIDEEWHPARLEALRGLAMLHAPGRVASLIRFSATTGEIDAIFEGATRNTNRALREWMRTDLLKYKKVEPEVRNAAIRTLTLLKDKEAEPRIRKLLAWAKRKKSKVVLEAECVLALKSDPKVVREAAGSKRWQVRVAAALSLAADDPLRKKLRADRHAAVRRAAGADERREIKSVFDMNVRAGSVMFLIDASVPNKEHLQRSSRREFIVSGMKDALTNVAGKARFGMTRFTSHPYVWDGGPTEYTNAKYDDAIRWIDWGPPLRREKDTARALRKAFEQSADHDTIVLITDNHANYVREGGLAETLAVARIQNRFARMTIHVVVRTTWGPKEPTFETAALRLLAKQNGGTVTVID